MIGHALALGPRPGAVLRRLAVLHPGRGRGAAGNDAEARPPVWRRLVVERGRAVLASGALAYSVTTGPHLLPARVLPAQRDHAWKMAAINLAGCVFFAVSAGP